MNLHLRPRVVAFAALLLATAAALLAAPAAAASADPAEVAAAYLRARAAAVTSSRPADVLAPYVAAGGALAARETAVARGAALRQADLKHSLDHAVCDVVVRTVSLASGGDTATVEAHAVVTLSWHAGGGPSVEASGLDHTLTLRRVGDAWKVVADAYNDDEQPALLERAGAPAAQVRAAARRLETRAVATPVALSPATCVPATPASPTAGVAPTIRTPIERFDYDREAARDYADQYALSYNPTYARFSGDCCNFASQSAFAGGMPVGFGDWTSGWWYDKNGTSSPSDDQYSWSWISCSKQIAFWIGTRTDWVSSISGLGKGDVIYYDWTGDGVWDHVAVVAGWNSAAQKVIDAHTTDHYRVFWKLGSSSTRYKFGRVRDYWLI